MKSLTRVLWDHPNKFPDPHKQVSLWFERPKQHPGRREHVHGPIHAMNCKCETCRG